MPATRGYTYRLDMAVGFRFISDPPKQIDRQCKRCQKKPIRRKFYLRGTNHGKVSAPLPPARAHFLSSKFNLGWSPGDIRPAEHYHGTYVVPIPHHTSIIYHASHLNRDYQETSNSRLHRRLLQVLTVMCDKHRAVSRLTFLLE